MVTRHPLPLPNSPFLLLRFDFRLRSRLGSLGIGRQVLRLPETEELVVSRPTGVRQCLLQTTS